MELRGFFCVELRGFGVEPIGFWFGTEGFWGLKRSGLFVWNSYVDLRGGCGTGGTLFYIFFVGNV